MNAKFLVNPENLVFFAYDEVLKVAAPYLVEATKEEIDAIKAGVSWDDVLAKRSSIVNDIIKLNEEKKREKLAKEMEEVNKEDHSVKITVDKKSVAKINKENEQRGEPNEFGETKRIFENINKHNVTTESLSDVKDEELHTFAVNVLKVKYNPVPDGIDDEQKKLYFATVRADIEGKIFEIVSKREGKKINTDDITLADMVAAEKEVDAAIKKRTAR